MTSEAAGTRPIMFNIKSYPCMSKAGSHSIQGMAGHSGQTRKQIPLCFISIDTVIIMSEDIGGQLLNFAKKKCKDENCG